MTAISPVSGPAAGGTAVTLTGTGFTTGATVTIGGVAATNVIVVSATSITAVTAAHAPGAVDVVVTNLDGQSGSLANGFTFVAAPTVTAISPVVGPAAGGTAVTLTGTGFTTGATVTIGGVAATNVVVVSATSITAVTAAHAPGAVDVVVTNLDGQSGSLANGFTFVAPPTVTSISPVSGPAAGGTAVTLTGTDFTTGATVTIGGVAATNVIVVSATSITAVTAAHCAGAVDVVVTNPDGQSGSLAERLHVRRAADGDDHQSHLRPVGRRHGGDAHRHRLHDRGDRHVRRRRGDQCDRGERDLDHAVTPAHCAGAVDVVVTNPDGQSGSAAERLHVCRAADGDDVSPISGPAAGGTAVTLTGTGFTTGATVTIGGVAATNVIVVSATSITLTTRGAQRRGGHVVVTNPDGQSGSLAERLHVCRAADGDLRSVPLRPGGRRHGGDAHRHRLHDRGHRHDRRRRGDQCDRGERDLDHGRHGRACAGAVHVVVTNPDGQSGSLANGFTFVAPPTVTAISPTSGPSSGGTAVTLTGTGFTTGATVTIGGVARDQCDRGERDLDHADHGRRMRPARSRSS